MRKVAAGAVVVRSGICLRSVTRMPKHLQRLGDLPVVLFCRSYLR